MNKKIATVILGLEMNVDEIETIEELEIIYDSTQCIYRYN